jgi:hypothetical protein
MIKRNVRNQDSHQGGGLTAKKRPCNQAELVPEKNSKHSEQFEKCFNSGKCSSISKLTYDRQLYVSDDISQDPQDPDRYSQMEALPN